MKTTTCTASWVISALLLLLVLLAPALQAHTVTINWSASSTTGVTYAVFRGTSSGGEGSTPLQTGVTALNTTDTSVTPGQTYYYTVEACYTGTTNCSVPSNEVAVVIPVTPVSGLTITKSQ